MQFYSNPARESAPHALPDCEVFQLTAHEVADSAMYDDEKWEFMKRPAFRLASMNNRAREAMLDAMVEELEITGGWFYWYCFPGCLPDGDPCGPFETKADAIADARANAPEEDED